MSLNLDTIKPAHGATKKRKTVGRGNASGHGTYSGRGLKGQNSRSGSGSGRLKRLGMKQVLLRTPKKRGFTSHKPRKQAINIEALNNYYHEGETVSPKTLLEKKLIDTMKKGVKILGKGELKVKNLKFDGVSMSESVKQSLKK